MTQAAQFGELIGQTVEALSRFDESRLLALEREAGRLSLSAYGGEIDTRGVESALRVLRMTLEATAANLRVVKRLRGEEGLWER